MKHTYLILLLLLSTLGYAQTSLPEIRELNRGFGNAQVHRIRRAQEIVKQVTVIAQDNGLDTKEVTLKTPSGESYKALQILPSGSHELNQEAARIDRVMTGLPLIFSPYDLAGGSNAFFDPKGTMIGVPYEFFEYGFESSSYQHELIHANMYVQLHKGQTPFWSGQVKLLKGSFVSNANQESYARFAANDEIFATALSIKLDALVLAEFKRTLSPKEFNNFHGRAADTLREIYFGAKAGLGLAKQTVVLATSALQKLDKAIFAEEAITLGRVKKNISVVEFKLDGYEYSYQSGRSGYIGHAGGTSFKIYFGKKPSIQEVERKLQGMNEKALASQSQFQAVIKAVPIVIDYPQIDKVNVDEIVRISPIPYNVLKP